LIVTSTSPASGRDARSMADLAQAGDLFGGSAGDRELRHQLHRDRERQHRPPVDAVVTEVAVTLELERVKELEPTVAVILAIQPADDLARAG
jgi:hypothetical protein